MAYSILSTKILSPQLHQWAKERQFDYIESSVIETVPCITPLLQLRMEETFEQPQDAAIFTSEQAIIALKSVFPPQDKLPWDTFCIHGVTKDKILLNYPKTNIVGTAGYGNELADKIIDSSYPHYHFFCGNRRREIIPSALTDGNKEWTEYIVYRTELIPKPLPVADFVMFYSPSGVESFFTYNTLPSKTICIAIGKTTAQTLEQYTQNTIIQSEETNPLSMLKAIEQYIQKNLTTI
ncbi:uroporphyrinogen-III synthase [Gynurincola endophyticus]|uniref:uroporphyrinogen-III synthase n=1 Tax=Gynurincola endophyticus TaxID=2479004 RepID=UPI000F8E28EA|nr:uroporphyrinogen-III synthase [Gynurincola endophyticus]